MKTFKQFLLDELKHLTPEPRQIHTVDDLLRDPAEWPWWFKKVARTEIEVPIGLLRATQKDVSAAIVKRYLKGKGDSQGSLPEVVLNKYTGEYLITDGHHRLSAEILKGNKTVKVELVGEID